MSCIVLAGVRCAFGGVRHELCRAVSAGSCQMFCCVSYIRPHAMLANVFVGQHAKPGVYVCMCQILGYKHIRCYVMCYTGCCLLQVGHVSCAL